MFGKKLASDLCKYAKGIQKTKHLEVTWSFLFICTNVMLLQLKQKDFQEKFGEIIFIRALNIKCKLSRGSFTEGFT